MTIGGVLALAQAASDALHHAASDPAMAAYGARGGTGLLRAASVS